MYVYVWERWKGEIEKMGGRFYFLRHFHPMPTNVTTYIEQIPRKSQITKTDSRRNGKPDPIKCK